MSPHVSSEPGIFQCVMENALQGILNARLESVMLQNLPITCMLCFLSLVFELASLDNSELLIQYCTR